MPNLNDTFLADLDELSDDEARFLEAEGTTMQDIEEEDEEEDSGGIDSISKLQKTQRYVDTMQKVDDAIARGSDHDLEHKLFVDSIALLIDIEQEIAELHNFIRDKYHGKFPELDSLVPHPIDYARVVKRIGNETDTTVVDLHGLLPAAMIMVVSVTASTTTGKPLTEGTLKVTTDACDRALDLDSARNKILELAESRIGVIAPNLTAVVGTQVAARLVGAAGSLSELANLPSDKYRLLGANKKNHAGFSTVSSQRHVGYIAQAETYLSVPPPLREKACKLLADKSALAARIDSAKEYPTGKEGRAMLEDIRKKIGKLQELPPVRTVKPLAVSCSAPKKKKGGALRRKMKDRNKTTSMMMLANRMQFGVPEESSLGDGFGEGYGMLGQAGSGKLRVSVAQSRLAAKVAKKMKSKNNASRGASVSGMVSSLAFSTVQGIELADPQAEGKGAVPSGTQSIYFSEDGKFSKIKKNSSPK